MKLYNGDCFEIISTLSSDSVDLVLTDPPYSEKTHKGARTNEDNEAKKLIKFSSITDEQLRLVLKECGRVCKRWVIATIDWRHMLSLDDNPPEGLKFMRFGIWVKPNGVPQFTGDRPAMGWEAIAFLHKDGIKAEWEGGGRHGVFTYNKESGNEHPTQKPIKLISELVSLFSRKGDIVFDPFMGSGTTGVAAIRNGCDFIGIEKDENFFKLAERRIKAEKSQGNLFAGVREQEKDSQVEEIKTERSNPFDF